MKKRILSLCLFALLVRIPVNGQSSSTHSTLSSRLAALKSLKIDACTALSIQQDDSPTLTAPDGRILNNNLPPRTLVKMVLSPAKGSTIHIEIWLPNADKWNGRFLGIGNGGAAGSINPGNLAWPLASGYAAATTDMGTSPNANSGIGNQEVWKDFGFRATHLMTVVAKQVIKAYYGDMPKYSYFNGGSTGGQQGLQEAQRYPADYDGIIAAIPAHCRTPLHAYFLWNDQIFKKCPFTKEQEKAVIAAGNEYMATREIPSIAGKFISDPRCTGKDIDAVIALAMSRDSTLTEKHAEALRKLFDGPRHVITGERIFNGVPFGSSLDSAHGHLYLFKWVFGANKNLEDINFGADIDTYTAALGPYLNAENPDLSLFEKRGGKLIMTLGSADSVVPYQASIDYYERIIEHFGSLEKVKSFLRLFIIPGMAHGGGPGVNQPPNLLETIKNWREQGTVPDVLQGRRMVNGKQEMDMPIYPYPIKTGWDAATATFKPVNGPRRGVERIAERFRPSSKE